MKKGFKGLKVWEISKDLTVKIYKLTAIGKIKKDYGLRDQIRRAAVSVPSNIAEGDERESVKEAIRFFYIAKGSIAEIRTQIQIAYEVGYFDQKEYINLDESYKELSFKLGSLIKVRKVRGKERRLGVRGERKKQKVKREKTGNSKNVEFGSCQILSLQQFKIDSFPPTPDPLPLASNLFTFTFLLLPFYT